LTIAGVVVRIVSDLRASGLPRSANRAGELEKINTDVFGEEVTKISAVGGKEVWVTRGA